MASTDAGNQLTREHRSSQQAIRISLVREVSSIWRAEFDERNIDRSYRAISRQATPVILDAHRDSASEAVDYFGRFRAAEGVPGSHGVRPVDPPDSVRIDRSLGYAARVATLRSIGAGKPAAEAARTGMVRTAGSATRLASEGSRETLREAVESDPAASRWQRVTGDDPCAFCAMLAARGGVYRSSQNFEAHEHCGCDLEAVYRESEPSSQVKAWQELYEREAKRERDPMASFRKAYRRQQAS